MSNDHACIYIICVDPLQIQKLILKPHVLWPLAVDLGHSCFWSAKNLLLMWECVHSPVVGDCLVNDYICSYFGVP